MTHARSSAALLVATLVLGCNSAAPEPTPDPNANGSAATTAAAVEKKEAGANPRINKRSIRPNALTGRPRPGAPGAASAPDPLGGKFELADALKGFPAKGDLVAKIETDMGNLECKLFDDKAPVTVANFIGLARGIRPVWDGSAWVTKPVYDGTLFHRIIKGFMIQGGSMNGTEETGYTIPDELWGGKHDRAGLLCMANRGANTNSKQFFITDAAAAHLDSGYTIFGECTPLDVLHTIAGVPVQGDKPTTPPVIKSIKIERGGKSATSTPSTASSSSPAASAAPSAAPSAKPPASAAPKH